MTLKRWLLMGVVVILILLGVGYHLVFGYMTVSQVTNNTYVIHRKNLFTQIGANVVVHTQGHETIVVDTQLKPLAAATRRQAQALSNQPISQVYVTHWHPDHSGGIGAYSATAEVVAHKNTTGILSLEQEGFGLTKPDSYHTFPSRDTAELPSTSIDENTSRNKVEVVHYPNAHTNGDLVVYFDGAVAIGDLVWPGSFPFVDVHNGGSVTGLRLALQQIVVRSETDDRFIPGHGQAMSLTQFKTYLEMVSATQSVVSRYKSSGKSLQEIIALGLPSQWQSWTSSLVPEAVWITMVFESS